MTIDLTTFGLSQGETKVYNCLLQQGTQTAGILARNAKVASSNIYDILERLQQKGLVSYIMVDNTRTYQVTNFTQFNDYLEKEKTHAEQKIKQFQSILPELELTKKLSSPLSAQIYTGKKGLKSAYTELFQGQHKTVFFYVHEEAYEKTSENFYLQNTSLWKHITDMKGIVNDNFTNTNQFKKLKDIQFKSVTYPLPGCIDICNNKVLIVTWHEPIMGILISSETFATQMVAYFENVWNSTT